MAHAGGRATRCRAAVARLSSAGSGIDPRPCVPGGRGIKLWHRQGGTFSMRSNGKQRCDWGEGTQLRLAQPRHRPRRHLREHKPGTLGRCAKQRATADRGFGIGRPTHSRTCCAERDGSGMYSGSMHRVPTARCEQARAHGCGQLFKHCLLHRLKTTFRAHHNSTLTATLGTLGRLNRACSLLPSRPVSGAPAPSGGGTSPTGVTTEVSATTEVVTLRPASSAGRLETGFETTVAAPSSATVLVTQKQSQSTPTVRAMLRLPVVHLRVPLLALVLASLL